MPYLAVTAIISLRVNAIDMAHEARQITVQCKQNKVVVIAHQAIAQHPRVETRRALAKDIQQRVSINIVFKNVLATITSRGNVINRAGKFYA